MQCFFFLNKFYLFICLFVCLFVCFWLCWVFVAVCKLSLVVVSRGYSSLRSTGPRPMGFSSCGATASHCGGLSCCGAWALGTQASVVVVHGLSCSVACGFFQTKGRTCVPCNGRQILNDCATREVLEDTLLNSSLQKRKLKLSKVKILPKVMPNK